MHAEALWNVAWCMELSNQLMLKSFENTTNLSWASTYSTFSTVHCNELTGAMYSKCSRGQNRVVKSPKQLAGLFGSKINACSFLSTLFISNNFFSQPQIINKPKKNLSWQCLFWQSVYTLILSNGKLKTEGLEKKTHTSIKKLETCQIISKIGSRFQRNVTFCQREGKVWEEMRKDKAQKNCKAFDF